MKKLTEVSMKNKKRIYEKIPVSVEISGNEEALISGCTGILCFSKNKLAVRAKNVSVSTEGSGLTLSWAGDGRVMIRGKISSVGFAGEE